MKFTLNNTKYSISWLEVAYFGIIFFYFGFLVTDLAYNTAFIDEAIYATVGEEALRNSFWERGLSWMGGSYVYPIISATINRGFGLAGVRMFSVFCVIVSGVVAGETAFYLKGKQARVFAVFLFFSSAIALNLGQLGTYDAPALLFFSLAFYFALLSREYSKGRILAIFLSAMLFSLAVMSKYIAIILAPAILLIIFQKGWKWIQESALWSFMVFLAIGLFFIFNIDSLVIFFTGSAFKEHASHLRIASEFAKSLKIMLPVGYLGALWLYIKYPSKRSLVVALFIGSLLPFSYHFIFQNIRSMWKHLVFSQVMLAPLAGALVYDCFEKYRKAIKKSVVLENCTQLFVVSVIAATTVVLWIQFREHWRFQRSWPSATAVIEFLEKNRRDDDIVFAEGSSVYKYHLFSGFQRPEAWSGTWYFQYNNLFGLDAMIAAIEDEHFDFIILNGYYTGDVLYELAPYVSRHYRLVLTDTYAESGLYDRDTFVWVPKSSAREYEIVN